MTISSHQKKFQSKRSVHQMTGYIVIAFLISLLVAWLCLGIGLGGWQLPHGLDEITMNIRLPRLIVALIVGASLSTAGAALQALFDNPLADPSLIGTSGGAALGVVLVLSLGVGAIGVPLAAFLGALVVCLLILLIHRFMGGGTLGLLVLGFVVSAFCGAVVSLVMFLSDDLVLRSAMLWLSGSLAEAGFTSPVYAFAVMVLGLMVLLSLGRKLDILMLGEETAVSMGISVAKTRMLTVVGAALLTGAAVSLAGVIGFLGMMVPNVIVRSMGGGRQRVMWLSAWLGAVFLMVIDGLARLVAYPIDLPVGIVIALLGGPFFMWLFLQPVRR